MEVMMMIMKMSLTDLFLRKMKKMKISTVKI